MNERIATICWELALLPGTVLISGLHICFVLISHNNPMRNVFLCLFYKGNRPKEVKYMPRFTQLVKVESGLEPDKPDKPRFI